MEKKKRTVRSFANPPKRESQKMGGDMLTQQHMGEETNINNIMDKYRKTGTLPVATGKPLFGDFSNGMEFADAQMNIIRAQEEFDELPANIRSKFNNNPADLLDFVADEENRDEAEKLGLIPHENKKKVPEPSKPEEPVKTAKNEPDGKEGSDGAD